MDYHSMFNYAAHHRVDVRTSELTDCIEVILGKWNPHVESMTNEPGYDWRTWCQDRSRMVPLIRGPLQEHWHRMFDVEQVRLKQCLQYFLNIDANAPYVASRQYPELRSKQQGMGQRYLAPRANVVQPYDWYSLCTWMWEILFGEEDWHADVEGWAVNSPALAVK